MRLFTANSDGLATRRRFLSVAAGWLAAGCAARAAGAPPVEGAAVDPQYTSPERADDPSERDAATLISTEIQQRIDQGLAWLAERQQDDGSFGSGGYARNPAVTALAGLAFLSSGSTPKRGPYGAQVDRAVEFLTAHVMDSGFIHVPAAGSHGPMYGHGFATLFLAECQGMTERSDLRDKLNAAVGLIVSTQNDEGGWRYEPQRVPGDLSVTICQVMALRAARNAGVHVPNETIERCIGFVKRSQNADGGFMYMLTGGPSLFARSAAGVVALYSAGIYEGQEIERGLNYLAQFTPGQSLNDEQPHYFYGHYYAVQAMWHAGGDYWRRWYPAIRDELATRQGADGAWDDAIGSEYGTAMACLILQMPNNYLPIFQR